MGYTQTEECLTIQAHELAVNSVSISPDGLILATGSDDQTVKLWNTHTGEYLKTLQEQNSWVTDTVISPNGKILASCGWDGIIKVWDIKSGECLRTLSHKPYENMNITKVTGLTEVVKASLKALGALENETT